MTTNSADLRISLNRREAAAALGVSTDMIRRAKEAGRLRAKTTKVDANGKAVGVDLYAWDDLKAWFDSLPDA